MKLDHINDIIEQLKYKKFTMSQILNELIAQDVPTKDIIQAIINTDHTGQTCHQLLDILSQSQEYDQECSQLRDAIYQFDTQWPQIYFTKLDDSAIIPEKMHTNDACYDLYANQSVLINPGHFKLVTTDIGIVLPRHYCAMVCSRSGIAAKHGMNVMNAPGIIDSSYRGAIKVLLHNHNNLNASPLNISKHSRIAQLLIVNIPQLTTTEISLTNFQYVYTNTDRGINGFGSTGM